MPEDEIYVYDEDEIAPEENVEEYESFKKALIKRCVDAEISYEEIQYDEERTGLEIRLSAGSDDRTVSIYDAEDAKAILGIAFESYQFLPDYEAIWSEGEDLLEALIRPLNRSPLAATFHLFGVRRSEGLSPEDKIVLKDSSEDSEVTITIGPISDHLKIFTTFPVRKYDLSIRIKGLQVSNPEKAVKYLKKIADSVFFEIDMKTDIPLRLQRVRQRPRRRLRARRIKKPEILFPQYEYLGEPLASYWYGRSAVDMPLLQYLAYYQTIEFFFPIYSENEAKLRIQNILKTPGFKASRGSDIARVLAVLKSGSRKGFGGEEQQLRLTVQECIDPDEIRKFLESDEGRNEFFKSREKKPSSKRISLESSDTDLRSDVSNRIYDIRCKVVHTKTTHGEDEVELLLPFSKEADLMGYDIELIQYVARRVLIASSRELDI